MWNKVKLYFWHILGYTQYKNCDNKLIWCKYKELYQKLAFEKLLDHENKQNPTIEKCENSKITRQTYLGKTEDVEVRNFGRNANPSKKELVKEIKLQSGEVKGVWKKI